MRKAKTTRFSVTVKLCYACCSAHCLLSMREKTSGWSSVFEELGTSVALVSRPCLVPLVILDY